MRAPRSSATAPASAAAATFGGKHPPYRAALRRYAETRAAAQLDLLAEAGGRTPEVAALVRRQFSDLERALCDVIAEERRSGELTGDAPPLQAARTFQSAYGLRTLAKVTGDRAALLDVVEGALAAL